VRAVAFVVTPDAVGYQGMLGPDNRPDFGTSVLASRTPSLLNSDYGLRSQDGVAVGPPYFNENLPLRDEPLINTVPGAVEIQRVADHMAWVGNVASAPVFAPLLRRAPPAAVPARPFVVQYVRADQTVPNPFAADLIRAGNFADRVSFYRHDLNFGLPGVPANPHAFFNTINQTNANFYRIFLGAQHQVATFFASDGATVIHPTPMAFWEAPINSPLPDDLFFLPR
jgi:hypothetical protein